MLKKIMIVFIVVLIIVVLAFLTLRFVLPPIVLRSFANQQIKFQDEPPATPHKLELDFSQFDSFLSDAEYSSLESWLPEADLRSIQAELRKGSLSLQTILAFYAERIRRLDSQYNSVIRLSPTVLSEAKSMDERIASSAASGSSTGAEQAFKELTGLVVLVKDNIAVQGMNTSAGSYALADLSTSRHSFLVQTLVDKGALVLGKANLSELSNFMSKPSSNGFSTLGGQTQASYGKYDVGGSSSGSAVAASLGFATVTLGSETSGSLVYPAGQNSVVAIKPSIGLLSRDLIIPISEAMDTAGILGRTVSDVHMVFRAALARDESDPQSTVYDRLDPRDISAPLDPDFLKGKRIGIHYPQGFRSEMQAIQAELSQLGAEVIRIAIPAGVQQNYLPILLYGIKHDLNAFLSHPDVSARNNTLQKIVAFNAENESHAPYGQSYLEQGLSTEMSESEYHTLIDTIRQGSSQAIDSILSENNLDAIVSISNQFSGIYAPAGYPALTLPSGYRANGEPYGLTFVGSSADDFTLFQLAYSYEQGTKHRIAPKQ